MTNRSPEAVARETRHCREAAARARRLAWELTRQQDSDNLLRFAEEQEQRAAELQATVLAALSASPVVTHLQQQTQLQADKGAEGPEGKRPNQRTA